MRHTKGQRLQPFLRGVSLLPGESLPSLLIRLTAANFYDPPHLFTEFCTERLADLEIYDQLDCPTCPETFELLALLTGVSPGQLANASRHYFAPVMNLREPRSTITLPDGHTLELIHKSLRDDFRLQSNLQYCPLCLSQAAYHRLAWYPRAVAVCLEHQCFLLEKCWRCGKRLNMRALVQRQCPNCEADLTSVNPVWVKDDPFGWFVQESIYSWLGLPSSAWFSELGLPNQPSKVLYQILYGLYSSLETRMDWNYIYWPDPLPKETELSRKWTKQGLKPPYSYALYATAFKGLVDWPHGFHDFLTQYWAYTQQPRKRRNGVGLGILAYHWLGYQWRAPEFKFVQEAYELFLQLIEKGFVNRSYRAPSRSEFAEHFEFVSVEHAANLLGTTENSIYRLIQLGKISTFKSASHPAIWVKRSDVTKMLDRRADEILFEGGAISPW
jgi:hypothetical protein